MSMEKVGMIVEITAAARIIAADIAVTNYSIIPRAGGIICQTSKFASKTWIVQNRWKIYLSGIYLGCT
jgi:hypothetical protein